MTIDRKPTPVAWRFAGERLAQYTGDGEESSSDLAIARVYAGSIAAESAVPVYLEFCRASATAILRGHWPAVLALAAELDAKGALTGQEIDRVIEEAEFQVARAAELSRREAWATKVRASKTSTI
jgi:hypothetical protein